MAFVRRMCVWIVLICAVFIMCAGCSSSKTAAPSEGDAQGIDVSKLPPERLVFRYVGTGELEPLKALIQANPGLVKITDDNDYRTPLHVAAMNNYTKICQFLLDSGADPKAEDINGEIPADCARQQGNLALSKMLLKAAQKAGY